MAHTPGPWHFRIVTIGHPDNALNLTVGARDNYICRLFSSRATLPGLTSMAPQQEVAQANARLIAAAPALLAALERIAGHEYRADRRRRDMVDASEIVDLQRIARAAIAQAKGEAK